VTLDEIADCCIYQNWAQNLLSFAGYWRGNHSPSAPSPLSSSSPSSRSTNRQRCPACRSLRARRVR
jgi:hypothetical protein